MGQVLFLGDVRRSTDAGVGEDASFGGLALAAEAVEDAGVCGEVIGVGTVSVDRFTCHMLRLSIAGVVCWHKPVVKRLSLIGRLLELHF